MKLIQSFRYAFAGLWYCIRRERNFRIHLCAAALVLLTGYFAGFDGQDFATLLVTISLVLFAEIANTAIERTVDLFSPEYNLVAKYAKDLAAGAVLVCALLSIGTACALFLSGDSWGTLWNSFGQLPWLAPVYAVLLLLCVLFIVFGGKRDGDW